MLDIELKVTIPGATDAELDKARQAAWSVFQNSGDLAWAAACARFKLEGEQEELTDSESELCRLWDEALDEAEKACCAGWPYPPKQVELELVYDRAAIDAARTDGS